MIFKSTSYLIFGLFTTSLLLGDQNFATAITINGSFDMMATSEYCSVASGRGTYSLEKIKEGNTYKVDPKKSFIKFMQTAECAGYSDWYSKAIPVTNATFDSKNWNVKDLMFLGYSDPLDPKFIDPTDPDYEAIKAENRSAYMTGNINFMMPTSSVIYTCLDTMNPPMFGGCEDGSTSGDRRSDKNEVTKINNSNISKHINGIEVEEKGKLTIPANRTMVGLKKYKITYTISQQGANEMINGANAMADVKVDGVTVNNDMNICEPAKDTAGKPKLNEFECMVMFSVDLTEQKDIVVELKTTAKAKRKNEMRKSNVKYNYTDGTTSSPTWDGTLLGFSFSSNSPGIYTLFNDSLEDVTINKIAVRLNNSQIDLGGFDLDNPDLTDFMDLLESPFILPMGESREFDLDIELLDDFNIFSQAFVEYTGNITGQTSQDIQQHQHGTIPEPSSVFSLLALGTFGASATLKRKLKASKTTEKIG
ncbi:PEP-CTERM sorting domain-containing protein [Crocosphaera sp.]|uniref:PEP-CTERM sorting domain-containing protein n=1 Tax=Crocosphaera sp. TaxID=2729996 RepID=UPI003F5AAD57